MWEIRSKDWIFAHFQYQLLIHTTKSANIKLFFIQTNAEFCQISLLINICFLNYRNFYIQSLSLFYHLLIKQFTNIWANKIHALCHKANTKLMVNNSLIQKNLKCMLVTDAIFNSQQLFRKYPSNVTLCISVGN